ncbi:MFS transporter [Aestuariibacter sp. AA17]|uniref:MFS transporter n=1 Tax=Fluctibacter corallii TaxID=2984329 RepID=A0ABT3A6V0_9ALTE|nr:MFS transporter [Aestuariibacter sp. AA17]MCV2884418.1 MFS transporter [Aestuariibacter sp. AA17]
MILRTCLIALTVISVVCDTMLLPFYPQFFAREFAMESSVHTGAYIAMNCVTVMLALPFWAALAKRVNEVHIWVYTQLAAASLGLICYFATDLVTFWIASQLMLVFKASYLLIYPFVLRLEEKHKHLGIVGLFSVLMHFGGIGGALVGGWIFETFAPRDVFLVSLSGDLLQVGICLWLIQRLSLAATYSASAVKHETKRASTPSFIWWIGAATLGVYAFAFLARPFFATHWLSLSSDASETLAGFVYALPAWTALTMLCFNHYRSKIRVPRLHQHHTFMLSLAVASAGLFLHTSTQFEIIVLGRILLGIAMFQLTVLLEVMLFERSEPKHYAKDFSLVHIFQNLGVIAASLTAGVLVSGNAITQPFYAASAGFALCFVVVFVVHRCKYVSNPQSAPPPHLNSTTEQ